MSQENRPTEDEMDEISAAHEHRAEDFKAKYEEDTSALRAKYEEESYAFKDRFMALVAESEQRRNREGWEFLERVRLSGSITSGGEAGPPKGSPPAPKEAPPKYASETMILGHLRQEYEGVEFTPPGAWRSIGTEVCSRQTVRRVIERLEKRGDLEETYGGGRGPTNPKRYRLRSVTEPGSQE